MYLALSEFDAGPRLLSPHAHTNAHPPGLGLAVGIRSCLSRRRPRGHVASHLAQEHRGDLQAAGLKLSAEDIYSINRGSLKDAIVLFGGGCTAEVISAQGLILTNHHCGFGAITDHSTVENDRLKNGFWAANKAEELRNLGLTATFVVRMEDVTERIVPFMTSAVEGNEQARRDLVAQLSKAIIDEAVAGTHYKAVVRPFNYGNSYYLIVTETFRDVRLVGAPPASIGKFGGDTDNWMWPRHNADFSLFRIYAGPMASQPIPPMPTCPWFPGTCCPSASMACRRAISP